MAFKSFHRLPKRGEPGFVVFEATIAAAAAAVAFSLVAVLLNKQAEMSVRMRDLDLIEAVVNEDINAIRHQSRFWLLRTSPYSKTVVKIPSTPSSVMTYEGSTSNCNSLEFKGSLEWTYLTDLAGYPGTVPGANNIDLPIPIYSVKGYRLVRTITGPSLSYDTQGAVVENDSDSYTIRLTYSLTRDTPGEKKGTYANQPLSFHRTADILLPVQFFC